MSTASSHRWRFARLGGFDQVRLDSAEDVAALEHLDQKLWAALACPVKGLEFDERTLHFLDSDADGRIRAPELLAAVKWTREVLKDLSTLKAGKDAVALSSIDVSSETGARLLASAKRMLEDLGRPAETSITLKDVTDTADNFANTRLNGDGIVPPHSAGDEDTRKVLEEILAAMGGLPDRSGRDGVDGAKVEGFFTAAAAFRTWAEREAAEEALRPLGDGSAAALDAWRAVRAKVDDWFARCRLAAFDVRAEAALNRKEEEYFAIAAADLSMASAEVAALPVARVAAGRSLPLRDGINPAWSAAMATFRTAAVEPLLGAGKEELTEADWAAIVAKLSPRDGWQAAKPDTPVAALGLERVTALLDGDARGRVDALLAEDLALKAEFESIVEVEKLVRFHRHLHPFLVNFVNFSDFYSRDRASMFQAGTLYLDGRACELCIRVGDAGKHAALAAMAKAYLAYCDCTRPSGEKMTIVAAFTGGDSDFLMVGRNGIFYDRAGKDWDATITKVVENPISVRQAFWSPYKKFVRMIEEQVAKRAAAAEAESDKKLAAQAAETANIDKSAPAAKPAEPKKIDVGTVAAMGVAVGALGMLLSSIFGYVTGLFKLPFWKLSLALAGLLFLISLPSMLIAWLKLRQRNLAPILDANGWAVNGRVKLNVRFGATLTSVAKLPIGSQAASDDPFAEKPNPWPRILLVVLVIAFAWSFCDDHRWLYGWLEGTPLQAFATHPSEAPSTLEPVAAPTGK